jgi:hypothetical protein
MSSSRAAGVSLSQSLTTSMSQLPESTIKALKKDTNNLAGPNKKIKQDACKEFLKEYKKFVNGEIESVTHPVTKKPLSRKDRIDFIADQCRTAFSLNISDSKSKSSSGSDDDVNPYKHLKNLTFSDIDKILEYPMSTPGAKNKHLLSLFSKNPKQEKAANILNAYLEDETIQDDNVLLYRKIKQYIKSKYLRSYDPFMSAKTFRDNVRENYGPVGRYGSYGVIADEVRRVMQNADELFKEALLYSDNNKTEADFKAHIKENYYKYYAVEFILLASKGLYHTYGEIIQLKLILLDKLIEGTVNIADPNASKSFDKSRSWSASPEDPILKAQYNTNKKRELERIMDAENEYAGSINDADFYTMEEWADMPLSKLQNVIVIPYSEGGKVYANAYYIKSLYTAWYLAIKDGKPFLNPANRKPFSMYDKQAILTMMENLYPGIKEPRYGSQGGRSDITVSYTRDYNNIKIEISYLYKYPQGSWGQSPNKLPLISINFPHSFVYADDNAPDNETNVPLAYNPTFLFDMINKLMRENKIISKKVPLKISDIFLNLNNKLLSKTEYMSFFDQLRLLT